MRRWNLETLQKKFLPVFHRRIDVELVEELLGQGKQLETFPGCGGDIYGEKLEFALTFLSRLEELHLHAQEAKMNKINEIEAGGETKSEKDRLRRICNETQICDLLKFRMAVMETRMSAFQSLMKVLKKNLGGING